MTEIFPLLASDMLAEHHEYSCHAVDEEQPWHFALHHHVDCCDLIYVHRGELRQEVNEREMVLGEGSMALIRHGDRHRVWGRRLVMYNLNFRDEALRLAASFLGLTRRLDDLLDAPEAPTFDAPPAARSQLLLDLQSLLFDQHRPDASRRFRGFLVRWLLEVVPATGPATDADEPVPSWLAALLRFIDDNVELPVHVRDLAAHSGRSGEHIARCFQAHLGMTPSASINRARLNRAALLLAHTNRPILDVCYSLGYNSASYFYRLFRRAHGMPPRRYREMNSVLAQPG